MLKCDVITYQQGLSRYTTNVKDKSHISGGDITLERVEIVGSRSTSHSSPMLEQNSVLIGENAWGESSLLDALTLLLPPKSSLYHFERDDSQFPPGDISGREHYLYIILTFCELLPGRHRVRRYRPLEAC